MRRWTFILVLVVLAGLAGCDYLSYDESVAYEKEEIFSNYDRAKSFLVGIYDQMPQAIGQTGPVDGALRAAATDIAEAENENSNVQNVNEGSWSALQPVDSQWSQLYAAIRSANIFIKNADSTAFADEKYNEDYRPRMEEFKRFTFEARFLRAYFYYELAKRYGGVPLITSVLEPEQANTLERASFEEVVDFVVEECEAVIPHLPVNYMNTFSQETGRATRGAAMALKSRMLLYAASELHNPSNETDKWVEAAEASKAIIDSNYYSLESNYGDIFNNYTSDELIWERREGQANTFEQANFPISFVGEGNRNENATWPTQNLVSVYEMQTTGKDIDEQDSGYNPEQPYKDRDPRLYETVITNGSQWKGKGVNIWENGKDGLPQQGATETGYYLKKHVVESIDLGPGNSTSAYHMMIQFRYGGILLDYAEAMNEAYGPNNAAGMGMTALEAANKVRTRANMPPFPSTLSKGEFREELREERMVELAFENQRFWDIRRWMIGPSTTRIYGMQIDQISEGNYDYNKFLLEERVWEDKFYLYPIPQSELYKNDALEQNPGW